MNEFKKFQNPDDPLISYIHFILFLRIYMSKYFIQNNIIIHDTRRYIITLQCLDNNTVFIHNITTVLIYNNNIINSYDLFKIDASGLYIDYKGMEKFRHNNIIFKHLSKLKNNYLEIFLEWTACWTLSAPVYPNFDDFHHILKQSIVSLRKMQN